MAVFRGQPRGFAAAARSHGWLRAQTQDAVALAGGGGRVVADWPGLAPNALLENRDLMPSVDLRSVFKGVLDEHLRVDAKSLATRVFPDSCVAPTLHGLIRA
jgi:uncharacterized protein (DUF1501 family)